MSVGELRRKAEQEKRLEAAEQTRLSQFPTLGASPGRLTPSTFAGRESQTAGSFCKVFWKHYLPLTLYSRGLLRLCVSSSSRA